MDSDDDTDDESSPSSECIGHYSTPTDSTLEGDGSIVIQDRKVNRLLRNARFIQLDFTLPSFKPLAASGNWQLDAGKILDLDYLQGPATEPPLKEMRITYLNFPDVMGNCFFDINLSRVISVIDALSASYKFMHTPINSQKWDAIRSRGEGAEYITKSFSHRIRTNNIDYESLHGACCVDTLGGDNVFKEFYYEHDVERDDGRYIPVFILETRSVYPPDN